MRDKRSIDELSIEELERILAIRRRQERQGTLERLQRTGRRIATTPPAPPPHPGKQHPAPAAILASSAAAPRADSAPHYEDAAVDMPALDPDRDHFWRSFVNQALVVVEVVAVLGLLYLGYQFLMSIQELETETANAQRLAEAQRSAALPTIAPTPQLTLDQVVLPGGHTPPTSPTGAQFNLNEIPPNLLPVVQSQIFQPVINRTPQTDETPLRLIIPKLNLNQAIVQGTDWEALKMGVGQTLNGYNPADERGNVVLAAHNDIYGELFRHLDQLEPGDRFQLQTATRSYTYVITGWEIVAPTDVHVMNSQGRPTATLISCYPYQVNDKRIVVFADREN